VKPVHNITKNFAPTYDEVVNLTMGGRSAPVTRRSPGLRRCSLRAREGKMLKNLDRAGAKFGVVGFK
jgi:hypothetical protein